MSFRAYAKINIGLHILGKRPDGYHNIETIFHQINLYDELTFEPAEDVTLTTSSNDVPADSRNLCVRAALLFREHANLSKGIKIHLTKRIPVGAGLGGGSSDAAVVLVALNTLWHTGLTLEDLESLGAKIGSDVPFFIRGGSSVGTSRGEILEHFDLRVPYWILTVTPPVHVSTAWAYANVTSHTWSSSESLRTLVERTLGDPGAMQLNIQNDFAKLVFQTFPEIRKLKDKFVQSGALVTQLSGSGSSVFGFFENESRAKIVASEFASPYSTSLTAPDFKPKILSANR